MLGYTEEFPFKDINVESLMRIEDNTGCEKVLETKTVNSFEVNKK